MEPKAQPAVSIAWDAERQAVAISLDPAQVKNWQFAKALIDMARDLADHQNKVGQVAAMQQQAAQQQQEMALRRQLRLSH